MNVEMAAQQPRAALVEGPIYCVHTGPSGMCSFGKQFTSAQLGRALRAGVRAIDVMWDGPSEKEPEGAWQDMVQIATTLDLFFDTRLVKLPWGDPGDYTTAELDSLRAQAIPASAVSPLARI